MEDKTQKNQIDYQAITQKQQSTWATGDFHTVGRKIIPISEDLVRAVDPHAGTRILDVACGSGNTALVAARRDCNVSGIDYVPELIDRAHVRAQAEGVDIDFRVGDAQELPFPDASFDMILSVFGVMFAPDQTKTASELVRVCRPGGTIGLVNWMPEGFGGDFFKTISRYAPPPPGVTPPLRWGTEAGVTELLGEHTSEIKNEICTSYAYDRSIEDSVELFSTYFGPVVRTLETLDDERKAAFKKDIGDIFKRYNRAGDGTVKTELQYMQTIARRA